MSKNNGNVGNAVRELAPGTTWKLHEPANLISSLEWLDDPKLRPSDKQIADKVAELDAQG